LEFGVAMSYELASANSGAFGPPVWQKKAYYGMMDAFGMGPSQRQFDNDVNETRSNMGVKPVVGTNPVDPYPYKTPEELAEDEAWRQRDADEKQMYSYGGFGIAPSSSSKEKAAAIVAEPYSTLALSGGMASLSRRFKQDPRPASGGQSVTVPPQVGKPVTIIPDYGPGPYDQRVVEQEPELPLPATRSLEPKKEVHFVKPFVQEGWVRPRKLVDEGVYLGTRQRTRLAPPPPPPPSYPGSSGNSSMSTYSSRRSSFGGEAMDVDDGMVYPHDPKVSFRHNFVGPLLPGQYRRAKPVKKKASTKKKSSYKRYGSYGRSTGLKVYRPLNLVAGRIHGRGDYSMASNASNIRKNSVINMGAQIPAFGDMKFATVVRHREFIRDIDASGSTAFTVLPFALNPAQSGTFPWLAQIAANYDQYQFIGCVFEYITTSSESATSLPMGSVIMSTDYDSTGGNFLSKQIMENNQYCTSGKPSCSIMHAIECDPRATSTPIKYVRAQAVPSGTDIRLYDHGIFQLATVGLPVATGNIGELWVTYEVALYKPQLLTGSTGGLISPAASHFVLGNDFAGAAQTSGLGTSNASAIAKLPTTGSSLGFLITGVNQITAPVGLYAGNYSIMFTWVGAATTLTTAVAVTFGTGLTALNFLYGSTTAVARISAGATLQAEQTATFFFTVATTLQATATITLTAGTLPGTATQGDVLIQRMPDALV
jgi:hypothetical protein